MRYEIAPELKYVYKKILVAYACMSKPKNSMYHTQKNEVLTTSVTKLQSGVTKFGALLPVSLRYNRIGSMRTHRGRKTLISPNPSKCSCQTPHSVSHLFSGLKAPTVCFIFTSESLIMSHNSVSLPLVKPSGSSGTTHNPNGNNL